MLVERDNVIKLNNDFVRFQFLEMRKNCQNFIFGF